MVVRWLELVAITLIFTTSGVTSNPDGVPTTACVDMAPGVTTGVVGPEGHLTQSQNVLPTYGNSRRPPYYIAIGSTEYTPGQELIVTIVANQTTGMVMYKGLFMQARRIICASDIGLDNETIIVEDAPIGTFKSMGSNQLLKTMTCGGVANSALCHRSPQFKINETATWVAPAAPSGHIVLRATLVQEAYIYWTRVHSRILLDPSTGEAAPRTCGACRLDGYKTLVTSLLAVVHLILLKT